MQRRFKISDCLDLLDVDGKTFHRWLVKADIDLNQQRNRADTRKKWLTVEQILQLARDHDREVHFPDEAQDEVQQAETTTNNAAPANATLQEILAALRHLEQHIEQLAAHVAALPSELRQAGATTSLRTPTARIATSTPLSKATTKTTTTHRKRKTTKKSKKLPATLTPLSTFRQLHGVSEKAVDNAIQRNKLVVIRGAWHTNNRAIGIALDRQAQQQFYTLFHEREGFARCDQCPHALAVSS